MSEMRYNYAVEDTIKLEFAKENNVSGAKTWSSPKYLEFRAKKLDEIGLSFDKYARETGTNDSNWYYDNMNPVYQKKHQLQIPRTSRTEIFFIEKTDEQPV